MNGLYCNICRCSSCGANVTAEPRIGARLGSFRIGSRPAKSTSDPTPLLRCSSTIPTSAKASRGWSNLPGCIWSSADQANPCIGAAKLAMIVMEDGGWPGSGANRLQSGSSPPHTSQACGIRIRCNIRKLRFAGLFRIDKFDVVQVRLSAIRHSGILRRVQVGVMQSPIAPLPKAPVGVAKAIVCAGREGTAWSSLADAG